MSERKYRQRGYQDAPAERQSKPERPREPRGATPAFGPRTPNMPGFKEVWRCSQCGNQLPVDSAPDARCRRCGADLHACAQCASFDGTARVECLAAIPARISPKETRNDCTLFQPRITLERETGSTAPTDARKAFDDLFR